jgi:anti-anti-sigma factor
MPASISSSEVSAEPDFFGSSVRAYHLEDGLVVRLSGVLDGQAVPDLRQQLLTPLPENCQDVLVDAGAVETLDDEALAVLVAGSTWARAAGARFALSSVSTSVAQQIEALELAEELPSLASTD